MKARSEAELKAKLVGFKRLIKRLTIRDKQSHSTGPLPLLGKPGLHPNKVTWEALLAGQPGGGGKARTPSTELRLA